MKLNVLVSSFPLGKSCFSLPDSKTKRFMAEQLRYKTANNHQRNISSFFTFASFSVNEPLFYFLLSDDVKKVNVKSGLISVLDCCLCSVPLHRQNTRSFDPVISVARERFCFCIQRALGVPSEVLETRKDTHTEVEVIYNSLHGVSV